MPILVYLLGSLIITALFGLIPRILAWFGLSITTFSGFDKIVKVFEEQIVQELNSLNYGNLAIDISSVLYYVGIYQAINMILSAYVIAAIWNTTQRVFFGALKLGTSNM